MYVDRYTVPIVSKGNERTHLYNQPHAFQRGFHVCFLGSKRAHFSALVVRDGVFISELVNGRFRVEELCGIAIDEMDGGAERGPLDAE